DAVAVSFDQQLKGDARTGRAARLRALDRERGRVAAPLQVREEIAAVQDPAAALEPVLRRHALERRHDRILDPLHRVAPRARAAAGRLAPPVGDAGAADE